MDAAVINIKTIKSARAGGSLLVITWYNILISRNIQIFYQKSEKIETSLLRLLFSIHTTADNIFPTLIV